MAKKCSIKKYYNMVVTIPLEKMDGRIPLWAVLKKAVDKHYAKITDAYQTNRCQTCGHEEGAALRLRGTDDPRLA